MEEYEKLVSILTALLDVDETDINEDAQLSDDLGADSMDVFQILMAVEMEFGLEVDNEESEHVRTVGDILQIIRESR